MTRRANTKDGLQRMEDVYASTSVGREPKELGAILILISWWSISAHCRRSMKHDFFLIRLIIDDQ